METSKANNNRAFTLVEMMVVVGIVIVITGLSFVGYKSGQSQYALQISAQELASNLRKAQSMALSTVVTNGGQISGGGYGIYLDKSQNKKLAYTLFADNDADSPQTYSGLDKLIETIELKKGVEINNISLTKNGDQPSNPDSTYVIFTPPDPTITIGDNSADQLSITICLENATDQTKTITINKFGKIDIE